MNYMHKILCLLALLPATAASVQAQSAGCIEILDGSARVREIAVSHNDDKLFVSWISTSRSSTCAATAR